MPLIPVTLVWAYGGYNQTAQLRPPPRLKTDSLFYFLFQTAPGIVFELLGQPAWLADSYDFRSVELKQTAFRIDGVLVPRPGAANPTVWFIEVQFQRDPHFYHRFFAEIFLFLRQHPETVAWRAGVLFAKPSLEPEPSPVFQALLEHGPVQRIYLETIKEVTPDSLGLGLVRLIVSEPEVASEQAKALLGRARDSVAPSLSTAAIIELVETIMVYKFPQMSREAIEQMLGLSELKQTRVYQEALQEGRQEEGLALILRQLARRVGPIASELEGQVRALTLPQLEALGEALLDFTAPSDLTAWLQAHASAPE